MFLVGTLVSLLFPSVDLPCRDGHELILKTLCANVVSQKRMDAIHSGFPVGVHYQNNIYICIYRRVGIEHVAVLAILCAHGFTIINFSAQNTNHLQVSSCQPKKKE